MCGIAGFAGRLSFDSDAARRHLQTMTGALAHRGPDGAGLWVSEDGRAGLGHRRLSIVDLSPAGSQPMLSADGRWRISYNGEVYNHAVMRRRLLTDGAPLRGASDTEVLLEWIARYGLNAALEAAEGMFAIALWDHADRSLTLIRDRIGIKPLYWFMHGEMLAFASELKAFSALPFWRPEINANAAADLLRHGWIPAPGTIYRGVHKLEAGSILRFSANGEISTRQFWSARDEAARRQPPGPALAETAALDQLEAELRRCIGQEMSADVPVGAFLSGGIDSSLVTALAQQATGRKVNTFSVGFDDPQLDESRHAAAVARHLGTEHAPLLVSDREARDVVPLLPLLYDEPLSDMAAIPLYLLSKAARQTVTVCLSGDGGDELFWGYERYRQHQLLAPLLAVPGGLRAAVSAALERQPAVWLAAQAGRAKQAGRLGEFLRAADREDLYRRQMSLWPEADSMVRDGASSSASWSSAFSGVGGTGALALADILAYLPENCLVKVDRASMAASLEARVPLLNHQLARHAFALPDSLKQRGGTGKWALREILRRHVPREIVDRPKQGFAVPMANWLRGPLRGWAEHLLSPQRLPEDGLIRRAPVMRRWEQHISGAADWSYPLWAILVLQQWREHWRC